MKLSQHHRDQITMKLLKGRFDERVDALIVEAKALAEAIYKAHYSEALREKMESLPDWWLNEADSIRAKFSNASGDYACLDFNGSDYFLHLSGMKGKNDQLAAHKEILRRFLAQDDRLVVLCDDKPKLIRMWRELQKHQDTILTEHGLLETEISNVLNSVTTIGALVKRWPEIAEIVQGIVPVEVAHLPAPILTGLNRKLGLKKVAA